MKTLQSLRGSKLQFLAGRRTVHVILYFRASHTLQRYHTPVWLDKRFICIEGKETSFLRVQPSRRRWNGAHTEHLIRCSRTELRGKPRATSASGWRPCSWPRISRLTSVYLSSTATTSSGMCGWCQRVGVFITCDAAVRKDEAYPVFSAAQHSQAILLENKPAHYSCASWKSTLR